jgi:H+-translocating NAD(P) transhydrogenase subunit beta
MSGASAVVYLMIDIAVIALWIAGIRLFRTPRGARHGNLIAAAAMLCAFLLVLYRYPIDGPAIVLAALVVGATAGYTVAQVVTMIQIPAMVAVQNAMGGIASLLVSLIPLMYAGRTLGLMNEISAVVGLTLGALTFSGSMLAAAKLTNAIRQTPQRLPAHQALLLMNLLALLVIGIAAPGMPADLRLFLLIVQIVLAALFGVLFSMRIGGADMPVLISFLNATTGLAAAFCGIVIENRLLIAFGATVAASGSILTYAMCTAMNRSLYRVFVPQTASRPEPSQVAAAAPAASPAADEAPAHSPPAPCRVPLTHARDILCDARKVVIVPGYGMALAKAQSEVVALADHLTAMGKQVKYAIHPVAGRMPGHMNVVLAEAGVDYDMLVEMDEVNPEFPETDAVLLFGACDVVNPAAIDTPGTPISGMPILTVHEARSVIVCNFDTKPGYSGVENPLYENPKAILLMGDAKKTAAELIAALADACR